MRLMTRYTLSSTSVQRSLLVCMFFLSKERITGKARERNNNNNNRKEYVGFLMCQTVFSFFPLLYNENAEKETARRLYSKRTPTHTKERKGKGEKKENGFKSVQKKKKRRKQEKMNLLRE